ncbi:MAG TPA: alanine racemase [Novosphingobium sp.]|nr:alanine racemase [Novosphingobium sp.]HNN56233.1 alanine racemase [Novosphingobium sp.]
MPTELPGPALRLSIDRDALAANWRVLNRLSGNARAGAAIKADAYGVGVGACVQALWDAGCRDFFVAHAAEADAALEHLPAGNLAVLHGPQSPSEARWMYRAGVRPVINSLRQARLWAEVGGGSCDLMVDTGINRIGLAMEELGDPQIAMLEVDVLHSHLIAAEEQDNSVNQLQRHRWQDARQAIAHRRAALANSAGIALGPAFHGDLTRPGLALYGGVPCAALAADIRQVVRPEAQLMQVREIEAGEGVGYNSTFVAPAAMRIGVLGIGYADGYLRSWSGKGAFLGGGRRLPVLGRVSMDMTVVDLGDAPELGEGDWVAAEYALAEAAAVSGLSQYELLTSLGQRFAR